MDGITPAQCEEMLRALEEFSPPLYAESARVARHVIRAAAGLEDPSRVPWGRHGSGGILAYVAASAVLCVPKANVELSGNRKADVISVAEVAISRHPWFDARGFRMQRASPAKLSVWFGDDERTITGK